MYMAMHGKLSTDTKGMKGVNHKAFYDTHAHMDPKIIHTQDEYNKIVALVRYIEKLVNTNGGNVEFVGVKNSWWWRKDSRNRDVGERHNGITFKLEIINAEKRYPWFMIAPKQLFNVDFKHFEDYDELMKFCKEVYHDYY